VGLRAQRDIAFSATRAAHDVALAALLGGNLFGRLAMNRALGEITDKSERGKVLNRAWRLYGTVNSLALVALVGGWLPTRLTNSSSHRVSARDRRLAVAKDVTIGAVVVTGLASAAGGVGFARQAPGGAVPMESGRTAAAETPAQAARLKRVINMLGALNILSELTLVIINASLSQTVGPGPPARKARRIVKYISGPFNAKRAA
jgi:hypothetical protein